MPDFKKGFKQLHEYESGSSIIKIKMWHSKKEY